jgi:hypothetical protein
MPEELAATDDLPLVEMFCLRVTIRIWRDGPECKGRILHEL